MSGGDLPEAPVKELVHDGVVVDGCLFDEADVVLDGAGVVFDDAGVALDNAGVVLEGAGVVVGGGLLDLFDHLLVVGLVLCSTSRSGFISLQKRNVR